MSHARLGLRLSWTFAISILENISQMWSNHMNRTEDNAFARRRVRFFHSSISFLVTPKTELKNLRNMRDSCQHYEWMRSMYAISAEHILCHFSCRLANSAAWQLQNRHTLEVDTHTYNTTQEKKREKNGSREISILSIFHWALGICICPEYRWYIGVGR